MSSSQFKKRKTYHHGDLRNALIAAAVRLVEQKGVQGFSLREAAREAGVAPSAPYRHFADRSELLTAVAEQAAKRLMDRTRKELSNASDEQWARFQALSIAYVRFAVENPSHFRVMNDPRFADPGRSEVLRMLVQEQNALFDGVLRSVCGQDFATDELIAARVTSHALVYGLARRFVDGHCVREGIDPEQIEKLTHNMTVVLGSGLTALC